MDNVFLICWVESDTPTFFEPEFYKQKEINGIVNAVNFFLEKSDFMPSFYGDLPNVAKTVIIDFVEYSEEEVLNMLIDLMQLSEGI